ncbi:MAG: glutathione S-transferase family protein [Parvibaculaceae bacterium]
MAKLHLVVGNKNYSSWSFRPWLALKVARLPFTEEVIPLDQPGTKKAILAHSPAGRVPVLHHGKISVWESLAILEYLADAFPDAGFWPRSKVARALARSVSNEMHAGFMALRSACPMNMRRPRKAIAASDAVKADVARIEAVWRRCRELHGKGGKFLFGRFSNADAMYAPVVNRLDVYACPVAKDTRAYMETVMALPAWREWAEAGRAEPWVIAADEA